MFYILLRMILKQEFNAAYKKIIIVTNMYLTTKKNKYQ